MPPSASRSIDAVELVAVGGGARGEEDRILKVEIAAEVDGERDVASRARVTGPAPSDRGVRSARDIRIVASAIDAAIARCCCGSRR